MDKLLQSQEETAEKMLQLHSNYKKDGEVRKTKKYLEAKITALKALYQIYVNNDDKVREFSPTLETNHQYFEQRKTVLEAYTTFIEDMRNRLNNGAPSTPTPQSTSSFSFETSNTTKNQNTERQEKSVANSDPPVEHNLSPKLLKQQDIRIRGLYREIRSAEDILVNNKTRPALSLKLKSMERMMSQIMDLHEQLCIEASEAEEASIKYFVDQHYENLNDEYNRIIIALTTELESQETCKIKPIEIKLKPIEIPQFHGEYMKWIGFADQFKKLVHDNSRLTSTHKMNYLKSHVTASAAKLLSHLEPTGDNYEAAWNILETRYNNRRLLVTNLLSTLLNQPTISTESAAAIRNLHDTTTECLYALTNTGIEVHTWSPFIIFTLLKKLDNESRRLYETSLENPREFQTTPQFLKFLERRFQSLETMGGNKFVPTQQTKFQVQPLRHAFVAATHPKNIVIVCICCQKNHKIEECPRFRELSISERNQMVMLHHLCRVCLCRNHPTTDCKSTAKCLVCKGNHHTLLHMKSQNQLQETSYAKLNVSTSEKDCEPVILATALVNVRNVNGGFNLLRALIDPGSQATFITEHAAQLLGMPKTRVLAEVSGISSTKGRSHKQIRVNISPRFPSLFSAQTTALVLNTITKPLPDHNMSSVDSEIRNGMILADPTFDTPGPIDLLIGADLYGEIMLDGIKRDPHHKCIAQKSQIGWIISGRLSQNRKVPVTRLTSHITLADIDKQLKRFWESEELHPKRILTAEEIECEENYEKTHKRLTNGRYEVRIPLKNDKIQETEVGESKHKAAARLLQMEKRFNKDNELKNQYHQFMEEYVQLNHMELINDDSKSKAFRAYYMPHHSIVKEDSTTTKLRVVFDASCKTTTGVSLNEMMHVGPTLQDNLASILIRWKKHRYVFASDIEKMFRQINIADEDQDLQRILWRSNPNKPMDTYRLKTVTYGTASATYLATKTLNQLAKDDASKYPVASKIVQNDFYVDDLLSGANTITEAIIAREELLSLLSGGGFILRKWNSNNNAILEGLPDHLKESGLHPIKFDDTVKTLGLIWNSSTDTFQFRVSQFETKTTISKRTILSESSKLFDPLGWLAPVIVQAKILLQDLWASGVGWDDALQSNFEKRWSSYQHELPQLEKIRIPRWINYTSGTKIELHGFCDASNQAYAAVVYSKINNEITLIAAKTRVAPLNQTISLPRLELNAALLLSKLLKNIMGSLDINQAISTYCWTDSMAALGWIKGKPQHHKTFVANRISEIQSSTNPSQWYHVVSNENPADCASRGLNPVQIITHKIWWEGPTWLQHSSYPTTHIGAQEIEEAGSMERKSVKTFTGTIKQPIIDFDRFSSMQRLVRSIAYCLRFSSNTRSRVRNLSHLTPEEINASSKIIIKVVQYESFRNELESLEANKTIQKRSTIITLNPFIDGEGLLRVGGRLKNSSLTFNEKHPIILPRSHQFSNLIIREAHKTTLHGGNQATLAHLRQKYWILHAKNTIRHIIHNCVRCVRLKKQTSQQLMGILPPERVLPSSPFTHSGVDYAGPINLKLYKGRCNKTFKGYIAIFICMATKAVHLELVSDLTTDAFLAAFKRFTSRRGLCLKIFSDCGTNFVGASKELKIRAQQQQKEAANKLAELGTEWHFIPPGSPHFGGLWEAGVKSTKHHLHRILGGDMLTFEELSTLLAQIEACLNSRPLSPISNDIDDDTALTPAHFLIGRPMIATPEPDRTNLKASTRWNLLTKITQQFWKRWSSEYLSRLQKRPKWLNEQPNIREGELVLIKDEQLPPTKWPLARVIQLHHGPDELVRVVTVKQNNNTVKRNITKICRLPTSNEFENDVCKTSPPSKNTRSNGGAKTSHLAMAMLSICCVLGLAQANIKVTPFNHSTGIYFEEIGKLEVVAMKWTLVIYYNMTNYWEEIETFKQAQVGIKAACNDLPNLNCNIILQQLEWQFNNLMADNELLQATNKEGRRYKRGLGDSTGIVLGDIFGFLTQREATHYESQFENINQNEEHLISLMKNQTSIIDNTIKLVKHNSNLTMASINNLIMDQQRLGQEMVLLNEYRTHEEKVRSVLVSMIELTLILKHLEDTQQGLLNIVYFAHHKTLHPSILTPTQLKDQLQLIRQHVPASITIPGHDIQDLIHIYQIMKMRSRVTRQNVIIEITLPLSFTADYNLLAVIPIPDISHGKVQSYIITSTEYLAMDNHREHFAFLTTEELNHCQLLQPSQFLCELSPVYNARTTKGQCEIAILQRRMELDTLCNIKTINATNHWIKLHAPNQWVYVVPKVTTVDLICGSGINPYNFMGSGVVAIETGCILQDENFHIIAIAKSHNNISKSFQKSSGLVNGATNLKQFSLQISNRTTDSILRPITAPDTADLERELTAIKERERLPEKMNHHDIHHYSVSYSIVGILIVLFAIFYCKRQPARLPPLPRPEEEA